MSKLDKNEDKKNFSDTKSNYVLSNNTLSRGVFHFPNGDEYSGDFLVSQGKITMHDKGVYKTSDGHVYEGIWESDLLKQANKITYPDKSVFSGTLEDMMIQGRGNFTFHENFQLEGNFINNNLLNPVYLTDPRKRLWRGSVEDDESVVKFHALHPFWQAVLSLPSKFHLPEDFNIFAGEAEEASEFFMFIKSNKPLVFETPHFSSPRTN